MAARKLAMSGPLATDKSDAPPVRIRPNGQPKENRLLQWERLPGLARKELNLFISLEPKVLRGDDADAIHDLRVSSRRLPLALQAERLVLQGRRSKKRYEEEFFEIVQHSPEWARLEDWVRSALPPEQPEVPAGA